MSSFRATFKGIFRAFFEKARKKRARFELFAELFFALVSSYLFSSKKVGQIRAIFRATEIELFSSYFLTLGLVARAEAMWKPVIAVDAAVFVTVAMDMNSWIVSRVASFRQVDLIPLLTPIVGHSFFRMYHNVSTYIIN